MLIDIETDRSQSILSQIKKCQLEFEPIIHQMNISAVIFKFSFEFIDIEFPSGSFKKWIIVGTLGHHHQLFALQYYSVAVLYT